MTNFLRLTSFFLFCPFASNLFENVKLHSAQGNVPKLNKFFSKNEVIALSIVFTRISAAALIKFPYCSAYLSNYCNVYYV